MASVSQTLKDDLDGFDKESEGLQGEIQQAQRTIEETTARLKLVDIKREYALQLLGRVQASTEPARAAQKAAREKAAGDTPNPNS